MADAADIVGLASRRTFDSPLVMNVFRSVLVEAMVSTALPDWHWCSADYAPYDFERGTVRLEVKQTALKQTWVSKSPSPPSWDIEPRTGVWRDGITWIPGIARNADIYVFGLHSVIDQNADHRDPLQWLFYVLRTTLLPNTQRLSVSKANEISNPVRIGDLTERVEQAVERFLARDTS